MPTKNWTREDAARSLRPPVASDDKYSRGVVGIRTGSDAYPGAAILGVEAAWRTGTGMVRYVGARRAEDLILARRPETVMGPGRVQAWVVGSGTDAASRSFAETEALRRLLGGDVPVVVDAGALDLAPAASAPLIVTPHARELDRLRRMLGLGTLATGADDEVRAQAAAETADALGQPVLCKGATTLVADPTGSVRAVAAGTPWLATAGTGDVLAGALGAVIAGLAADGAPSPAQLADAAACAAWLHGRAATLAATDRGAATGPVTALDVADALPRAVAEVMALPPIAGRAPA